MSNSRLRRLAERWTPKGDDPLGEYKQRLIRFLLENGVTSAMPMPINRLRQELGLAERFSKEAFQHALLGPLRRDPSVFIGTGNKGVFLVTTPEDADETLGFYTWRVRAELRHARNLRAIAKRTKLFEGYSSKVPPKKDRAVIYLDESGSPGTANAAERYFVVGAVVVESRKELSSFDRRFKRAFDEIGRPESHEMKASALSSDKHCRVLRELSLLDYSWAAACFDKKRLTSQGFRDPKTFYRYAFQFLVGDLLLTAWQADLVLDENSTATFQSELERHLRFQNSGLPVERLQEVSFAESNKSRLVQLADLVAGAVRRAAQGDEAPLSEIQHQMIDLNYWPPKEL